MLVPVAVAVVVGVIGWIYQVLKPTPPKICGSPGGPPVTSPRVKLSDGRHLAYREMGVPKEEANYKIIITHGFDGCKDFDLPISQELIDDLRIYFLFFDRAGYGESDPNPSRSVKSEAFDIQELADQLQIGSAFYVMGISLGAYSVWSCLQYIPHRLSGAALIGPFVNYWWPSIPSSLSRDTLMKLPRREQWTFRVAHHTPWLLHWWLSQKWFTPLTMMAGKMDLFNSTDLDVVRKWIETPNVALEKRRQQGLHESLVRDLIASYGEWEFSPLNMKNPFSEGQGSVHIWQGYEDKVIPFEILRYISEKLPWIRYHEIPERGHFFIFENHFCDAVLRALLLE